MGPNPRHRTIQLGDGPDQRGPTGQFRVDVPYGDDLFGEFLLTFVAALWIWDKYALGHIHKATRWGSLVVAISLLLPLAIGFTAPWLAFAKWATGLVA